MKMEPTVSSETSAIRIHLHRQVDEVSSYFIYLPMKMEPTVSSETSAIRTHLHRQVNEVSSYFIHPPMKMEPKSVPKRRQLELIFIGR